MQLYWGGNVGKVYRQVAHLIDRIPPIVWAVSRPSSALHIYWLFRGCRAVGEIVYYRLTSPMAPVAAGLLF